MRTRQTGIRDCGRIRRDHEFHISFFNQSITDAALSAAASDFLTELGPKPWDLLRTSKPIMRVDDRFEMYFQLKHMVLSLETRFVRRDT